MTALERADKHITGATKDTIAALIGAAEHSRSSAAEAPQHHEHGAAPHDVTQQVTEDLVPEVPEM